MEGLIQVIIKDDDIHKRYEVMELFSKLELDYDKSCDLIEKIQDNGEYPVMETTPEKALLDYHTILEESGFLYEFRPT